MWHSYNPISLDNNRLPADLNFPLIIKSYIQRFCLSASYYILNSAIFEVQYLCANKRNICTIKNVD